MKWRFKPDPSGPYKTVLEMFFSDGRPLDPAMQEEVTNRAFFAQQDKCRTSRESNGADAASLCKKAVELAEKLPKDRALERSGAYRLLGHVYFARQQFEEALQNYQKELEIGLARLKPSDIELGNAYEDVAHAFHGLRRTADAAQNYQKAEQTIRQAVEATQNDSRIQTNYAARLKQVREYYLLLLQQSGQTAAAAELEKRMQSAR